jgi:DNA gyrase subunit A
MQNVFGINIVALKDGQPRLLNLKQLLDAFIRHRREIVTRRTRYDLRKSRARAHILEGLAVSLANIDPVIALIKASPTPAEAKQALLKPVWESGIVEKMLERADSDASRPQDLPDDFGLVDGGYRLSEVQAQAILDLKLQRLTGLEQEKIVKEYGDILEAIIDLLDILSRPERLIQVIREELEDIRNRYGDERRTEILEDQLDLSMEDLITEEDVVVTLSHAGYAKSQPIDTYRSQRRGGKGKSATNMKDEDFIDKLFIASTHDTLLCFSSKGKLYWLKVYQLPQASRAARGKPIVNLLQLEEGERINAVLPIREFVEDKFIFMATADGTVKKCQLTDFARPRPSGLRAIELVDGNQLIGVEVTNGDHDIMLFSNAGKAVRFKETAVRAMGRTARGVRGIRLAEGQRVNSLIIVESDESSVLTVTENGFGKRTAITDYAVKGRGGLGVISIQTTSRNGQVVGAVAVDEDDEIMLISDQGTLIRTPVNDVSVLGRNTQGVTLVKLGEEEHLVSLERIVEYKDPGNETSEKEKVAEEHETEG